MMATVESGRPLDDEIGFERLATLHRANKRGYGLYAVALVIAGVIILGLGMAGMIPGLLAWIVGIMTILVAVFPGLASVENRERCEGIAVLRDEYLRLHAAAGATAEDRQRLADLIFRSYGQAH